MNTRILSPETVRMVVPVAELGRNGRHTGSKETEKRCPKHLRGGLRMEVPSGQSALQAQSSEEKGRLSALLSLHFHFCQRERPSYLTCLLLSRKLPRSKVSPTPSQAHQVWTPDLN